MLVYPQVCHREFHDPDTSALTEEAASALLESTAREQGLPTVDAVRTGVGPIVDAILRRRREVGFLVSQTHAHLQCELTSRRRAHRQIRMRSQ